MITKQDVDFYEENGYVLVKEVFTNEEVEQMRTAVEQVIQRAAKAKYDRNAAWEGDYLESKEMKSLVIKGILDVHYHDAAFTRAMVHPNIVSILTKLIGPDVQLHHSKMIVKPPENGAAFPMHQDYPYFPHANHSMLAASVHLDDSDTLNGCLRVIPKSHKEGSLKHVGRHYLDHKEYPIEMGTPLVANAGDVLFFNYLTIHGSDINRSERIRRNILFQYRDAADLPTQDVHINWGQGLMISGKNPVFREYSDSSTFTHRNKAT